MGQTTQGSDDAKHLRTCFPRKDPRSHLLDRLSLSPLGDFKAQKTLSGLDRTSTGDEEDFDAALEQEIFDLSQRQRVKDIQHHRAADYLGRTVEITARVLHRRRYGTLLFSSSPFTLTMPDIEMG